MAAPEEGLAAVLLTALVSVFLSLLAYTNVCAEQHACLKAGTCFAASNASFSCAFRTSITPAGWRMLNASDQHAALASMTRGVCMPGLLQNVDPVTGAIDCRRRRTYPDALNMDIAVDGAARIKSADASDPDLPNHRRWCGRWIDARLIDMGEEKWAFFDEPDVAWDVEDVIMAKGRVGSSDVSKFRSACRSMVTANAQGAAGKLAYEYLVELNGPGVDDSLDAALATLGVLSSHSCDAPVALGLDYGTSGRGFAVRVANGAEVSAHALREVLYAVGEPRAVRDAAAAFAIEMASIPVGEANAMTIEQSVAQAVHLGAIAGTWVQSVFADATAQGQEHSMRYAEHNVPLARFLKAFTQSPAAAGGGGANARAYLRGLSAYCAYASGSVINGGEMGSMPDATSSALGIRNARRPAAAIGRLRSEPSGRVREHIQAAEVYAATSVTWSQLSAVELASTSRSGARSACFRAAKVAFPDAFDSLAYAALVTQELHDRLEGAVTDLRSAAKLALESAPIAAIYAEEADRTRAADTIARTRLRIAGAPRGSWAGVARDFVRPEFGSEDGALLMLLKQARAVYMDRIQRVVRADSLCEHPPLFDALERNAYMLMHQDDACAVLMPGILVPPFADERYSKESLYARIGFVIAHEFMHATAVNKDQWDMRSVQALLRDYRGDHYVEAIADVGAMAALERASVANNRVLCAHVSQLFCARTGWLDGGATAVSGTHPSGNARGDAACAFLEEHFS